MDVAALLALVLLAVWLLLGSAQAANIERRLAHLDRAGSASGTRGALSALRTRFEPGSRARTRFLQLGFGFLAGWLGLHLAGPTGCAAGVAAGILGPRMRRRRLAHRREALLERQLAELVEATALAIRSGFSVVQAIDLAAEDASPPMAPLLERLSAEQRLGAPLDRALSSLVEEIGTEDVRLFALVVGIHHRSGGNVATAMEEVASTIRHRIRVRRELRALTAQGRISGVVLGALPIGFFLVLAASSHRDLAPVYRSPAGVGMIVSGLVLEAIAFAWIRRLLRVEV